MSVLCVAGALAAPRRYGLLLGSIALVLAIHSLPAHKEYRFVFDVVQPTMARIDPDAPAPPANAGIEHADPEQPAGGASDGG